MTVLPVSEQRLVQLLKRYGQRAQLWGPVPPDTAQPWRVTVPAVPSRPADGGQDQGDSADPAPNPTPDPHAVLVLIETRRASRHADMLQDYETADALVLLSNPDMPPQQAGQLRLDAKYWHIFSVAPVAVSARLVFRLQMSRLA